jgi:uncharacterized protein YkwD
MMNRASLICQLLFVLTILSAGASSASAQEDTALSRRRIFKTAPSAPVKAAVKPAPAARWGTTAYIESEIFKLINRERQKHGLSSLLWSQQITDIARRHSRDMADHQYFSHKGRNGSLVSKRADNANIQWNSIAENIIWFIGMPDPAGYAAEGWMNSRGHRENILTKGWKQTGIGAAVGPDGSYYITQVFLY